MKGTSRVRVHQDQGLALVVALVVTLLVFLLTTAILADAFHNIVGSANARERLTAINAAEAGVSWYSRAIESSGLTSLRSAPNWSGSGNIYTSTAKTVTGVPGSGTFTLRATYYMASNYVNASDALVACPSCPTFQALTNATVPAKFRVELTSVGTAGGVTRTVTSVMELIALHGSVNGAFAGIFICELGNRFTITGPYADLYLIGDASGSQGCPYDSLRVTSGQFTTSGSVYVVNGSAYLTNSAKIDGSLWAKGGITLGTGAQQSGNGGGQSATQCSSQNNAQILICGDVTSLDATPIVNQTARVLGTWGQCVGCALPDLTFTQITASDAELTFSSYTRRTDLPATFFSAASGSGFTNTLIVLPASCSSRYAMPRGTLNLLGNVAIVSPCGFEFGGRTEIRPANGITGTPTLYLITGYTATACATDTARPGDPVDARDIAIKQNFDATGIRMFLYTPCKMVFTNQTNITGQLIAKTLYAQGRSTINTVDLLGLSSSQPGYVSGFQSRVLSIREI